MRVSRATGIMTDVPVDLSPCRRSPVRARPSSLHTDFYVGGKSVKYVLSGEGAGTIFSINEKTGDIHAIKKLDREEKAEYTLTAQVVNVDTNEPLEPLSEFIIQV
ncbi:hypothetical protein ACEWY4_016060 [Coilia grayii]|uniref:Cadherin domain-containing protein n=1 Tax=Coilia grayii TaxID=363190 RepID=A0ABD1JQQ0_9TELE